MFNSGFIRWQAPSDDLHELYRTPTLPVEQDTAEQEGGVEC